MYIVGFPVQETWLTKMSIDKLKKYYVILEYIWAIADINEFREPP